MKFTYFSNPNHDMNIPCVGKTKIIITMIITFAQKEYYIY